jgi:hypothetical protein
MTLHRATPDMNERRGEGVGVRIASVLASELMPPRSRTTTNERRRESLPSLLAI